MAVDRHPDQITIDVENWTAAVQDKGRNRLADARDAHADTLRQIGALEAQRNQALLADDDPTAAKLYAELETLRGLARGHADKVALLEAEAAREEIEAVAKRRAAISTTRRSSHRPTPRRRFRTSWPLLKRNSGALLNCGLMPGPHGRSATRMPTPWRAPRKAPRCRAPLSNGCWPITSIELSARPFLGGRPGEVKEEDFPGAACPRNEVRGRPLDITPFADALRAASKFAVDMMKGKLDPLAALPPDEASTNNEQSEPSRPVLCAAISRNAWQVAEGTARLAEDLTPAARPPIRPS